MNAPIHWREHKARAATRAAVRKVQGNFCPLCGGPFGSMPISLEHVVPRARGGKHRGNVVVTHRHCNLARGDNPPTGCLLLWLAVVNARLAA